MTIKFNILLAQYESLQQPKNSLVVLTPSEPQFIPKKFWIYRCIDRIFRGYSYDLSRCTKELAKRALTVLSDAKKFENSVEEHRAKQRTEERLTDLEKYAQQKFDSYTAELTSALKVIKIAQNLLAHSFEKRPEKKRFPHSKASAREEARETIRSTAEAIAEYLGSKSNRTKAEVLLEHECYGELMQAVLQEGSLVNIDPEKLEPFLQLACDQKREEVVISLLQHKVSSKHLRNADPLFLATVAQELCRRDNDTVLSQLIEEQESISGNVDLFITLMSKNLPRSVEKFVEKGGNSLAFTDEEKNTLLHIAFLTGNPLLCRFLSRHLNPTARNIFNQTPLKAVLEPKSMNVSKYQFMTLNRKEFIERLAFREQTDPPPFRVTELSTLTHNLVPDDTSVDLIELFFLLGENPIKILPFVARETIETTFSLLKKKYPKSFLDDFYISFFIVRKDLLKTKAEKFYLPKAPPDTTPLQTIYTLFDSIPWTDTKIDTKNIYAALMGKTEIPENPQAEFRAILESFIEKIESKHPSSEDSFDQAREAAFYSQTELFLRHTIALIARKKDTQQTLECIIRVLRASKGSNEKCLESIKDLYRQTRANDEGKPRIYFENLMSGFRRSCLHKVIESLYGAPSPILDIATLDLSEDLGITVWKTPDAAPARVPYNRDDVLKMFFEKTYTPQTILYNFILPLLQQDDEIQEKYVALQKEFMPPTWNEAKYGPILKELQIIQGNPIERLGVETFILFQQGIERKKEEKACEAIGRARKEEYIKTHILSPQGDWNVTPIIELLERLGILSFSIERPSQPTHLSIRPRSSSLRNLFGLPKPFSPNIDRKSKKQT